MDSVCFKQDGIHGSNVTKKQAIVLDHPLYCIDKGLEEEITSLIDG